MKKLNELQEGRFVVSITDDTYTEVMTELKAENPKQYIPPKPKMQLVVEEFDGSRYELELFQVDSGIYKIFDVSAGNRWCDTLLAENNNWTFADYAEIIDSYTFTGLASLGTL